MSAKKRRNTRRRTSINARYGTEKFERLEIADLGLVSYPAAFDDYKTTVLGYDKVLQFVAQRYLTSHWSKKNGFNITCPSKTRMGKELRSKPGTRGRKYESQNENYSTPGRSTIHNKVKTLKRKKLLTEALDENGKILKGPSNTRYYIIDGLINALEIAHIIETRGRWVHPGTGEVFQTYREVEKSKMDFRTLAMPTMTESDVQKMVENISERLDKQEKRLDDYVQENEDLIEELMEKISRLDEHILRYERQQQVQGLTLDSEYMLEKLIAKRNEALFDLDNVRGFLENE